jgi:HEAT repeat protein
VLRRRRRRITVAAAVDVARWSELRRAALTAERRTVEALLVELRSAAWRDSPYDRGAAIDELLKAPPELWLYLDRFARRGGGATGVVTHPAALRGGKDLLRLLVASLDGDGYVRQAAVEGLGATGGPLAVNALVLRTTDWVNQVRDPAVAALNRRTAPDEAASAVRLLVRMRGRRRAEGVLDRYGDVLSVPERRRSVRALAADEDPLTRRFGVQLALRLGEYVPGDLLRTALRDPDQVCRQLCAQRLLETDPDQAARLLRSRSAAVRELAVGALPDDVPAVRLVGPLADRARVVRAQARWRLYSRGEPPVDVYRRQLRKPLRGVTERLLAGLVTGLGECGDASDVPLLSKLLESPNGPVVRRAVVRSLGRLAKPEDLIALLGSLALDHDPGVAREAFEALTRVAGQVPAETMWVGRTRPEPAVRRAAQRLLKAAGGTF